MPRRCRLRLAPAPALRRARTAAAVSPLVRALLRSASRTSLRTGAGAAASAFGSVLRTTACGSGRTARRSRAAAAPPRGLRPHRFPPRSCSAPCRSRPPGGGLGSHTRRTVGAGPAPARLPALPCAIGAFRCLTGAGPGEFRAELRRPHAPARAWLPMPPPPFGRNSNETRPIPAASPTPRSDRQNGFAHQAGIRAQKRCPNAPAIPINFSRYTHNPRAERAAQTPITAVPAPISHAHPRDRERIHERTPEPRDRIAPDLQRTAGRSAQVPDRALHRFRVGGGQGRRRRAQPARRRVRPRAHARHRPEPSPAPPYPPTSPRSSSAPSAIPT